MVKTPPPGVQGRTSQGSDNTIPGARFRVYNP